jgi:hypothetical protein
VRMCVCVTGLGLGRVYQAWYAQFTCMHTCTGTAPHKGKRIHVLPRLVTRCLLHATRHESSDRVGQGMGHPTGKQTYATRYTEDSDPGVK